MVIMFSTPEDRVKSFFYQEVARDRKLIDIGEYTRECMRKYDTDKFGKLGSGIANSPTLVDVLVKIAEEARNSAKDLHKSRRFWRRKGKTKNVYDSYDRKAFNYITRYCKSARGLVLEYYRFYKDLKRGHVEVYIDFKEEEMSEDFEFG